MGKLSKFKDQIDKQLQFIHNTSAEKLARQEQMGGMPMPSIAVTREDIPFEGFGDISLIGKPSSFDPAASRLNQVFSADAYTVRAPQPVRVARKGAGKKFQEKGGLEDQLRGYGAYVDEVNSNIWDLQTKKGMSESQFNQVQRYFETEPAVDAMFLESKGISVPRREDGDIDRLQIYEIVKGMQDERREFAAEIMDDYFEPQEYFISNPDRDYYRQSARLKPYDAEEITKFMKRSAGRGGEGGISSKGVGAQRAAHTEEFKSLSGMRKRKGDLVPASEMERIKDETSGQFFRLVDELRPYYKYDANSFMFMDEVSDLIQQSESRGLSRAFDEVGFENVPDEVIDSVNSYREALRASPTEYFESKPKRVVEMAEFGGAVVPEGTPAETLRMLERQGIPIETYDPNVPGSREEARGRFRDLMFQMGVPATAGLGAMLPGEEAQAGISGPARRVGAGMMMPTDDAMAYESIGVTASPEQVQQRRKELEDQAFGEYLDTLSPDTIEGVVHPRVGALADVVANLNRRLEGSPAELIAPEGLENYLRKLSYDDEIGYLDRLFANPFL